MSTVVKASKPETASTPADFILKSFNAFNPRIAGAPNEIVNNLNGYLKKPIAAADIIEQSSSQQFTGTMDKSSSAEETQSKYAQSVGLSASYGVFSGSVQVNATQEHFRSSTAYHLGYDAKVDCGSVYFHQQDNPEAIRQYLSDDLLNALNAIKDMNGAAAFTSEYGTHLIISVLLGGELYISAQANTTSESRKSTLGITAEAKYSSGLNSVSAVVSATQDLSNNCKSDSFGATIYTVGGDATKAAHIDANNPTTSTAWSDSCNAGTVRGIGATKEFWELATNSTAKQTLQLYVQLQCLIQSINSPSFFSVTIPCQPFVENGITAQAEKGYKVISGGASIEDGTDGKNGSNFLLSSYPDYQNNVIAGWRAVSHDIGVAANPATDSITAYAIAIYDPANLLKVSVGLAHGTVSGGGPDTATASVDSGAHLTGGGVQSAAVQGSSIYRKFLVQTFPGQGDQGGWNNSWTGKIWDYVQGAANIQLTVYAIGLASTSEHLAITSIITTESQSNVEYGNVQVSNPAIAGGGAKVTLLGGDGNLLKQCYPSSPTTWTEYNKDTAGNVSTADAAGYAIQLTANLVP